LTFKGKNLSINPDSEFPENPSQPFDPMQHYRGQAPRRRRPFWLPASNYYILTASAVIALFFLVWGILNDGHEETPWIPAGVAAAVVLGGAVILREIIMRQMRNRFLDSQRQIDRSVRGIARQRIERDAVKLTLERNAALLHEIARKSEAAKVLGRFAEGHREVFELCEEYIGAVNRELPNVGVGSPRIAALRRGTEVAERYHHYHLLLWAEIESRALTQEAARRDKISEKLESTQAALGVVESALVAYPYEPALLDSQKVLVDLVTSMKTSDLMDRAERAAFKGNDKRALSLYQDALFLLQKDEVPAAGDVIDQINDEIVKIRRRLNEA
jgi:hypothetical protein